MIPCVYGNRIERLRMRFASLYGPERAETCLNRLLGAIGRYGVGRETGSPDTAADASDIVLIAYADALSAPPEMPLSVLGRFLREQLRGAINTVHLLPFYPWSSDDGFSVTDYRAVHSAYGQWDDIRALGRDFGLMFDLVLNHASTQSEWFRDYVNGISPARFYFFEAEAGMDLSRVVRPRTTPLLHSFVTKSGERRIWSTFGGDQMDLDFRNPDLLFEFIDIVLFYLSQGARMFRLDAIAYLWKTPGTDCIHRPETHAVVKLLRDLLNLVAPGARLLTETNVPHKENIRYFGRGDEAHWVYQFPLPPLLLHAVHTQDSSVLTRWARDLPPPPPGCAYLNFTASHDGIGLRPLQGLVPDREIGMLAERMAQRGGGISRMRNADGSESPYELNITFLDALSGLPPQGPSHDRRRFLTSQAIMLSLQGVPAVYYHSLFGTRNDRAGMERSGMPRRINRRKFALAELVRRLDNPKHESHAIFEEYRQMLRVRSAQPAFHPEAGQEVLTLNPQCFALRRDARKPVQTIFCLSNLSAQRQSLKLSGPLASLQAPGAGRDLLSDTDWQPRNGCLVLEPWQTLWIQLAQE